MWAEPNQYFGGRRICLECGKLLLSDQSTVMVNANTLERWRDWAKACG
jgi:hypothetical protein